MKKPRLDTPKATKISQWLASCRDFMAPREFSIFSSTVGMAVLAGLILMWSGSSTNILNKLFIPSKPIPAIGASEENHKQASNVELQPFAQSPSNTSTAGESARPPIATSTNSNFIFSSPKHNVFNTDKDSPKKAPIKGMNKSNKSNRR